MNWFVRTLTPLAILSLTTSAACSRDDDVVAAARANDALVEAVAGSRDAQGAEQAFAKSKGDVIAKLQDIKDVRGFQVKPESMNTLTESLLKGVTTVCSLRLKAIANAEESKKYQAVCDDYTNSIRL